MEKVVEVSFVTSSSTTIHNMPSISIDTKTVDSTRGMRGLVHILATSFLLCVVFYNFGSFGVCTYHWLEPSPEYHTGSMSSDPSGIISGVNNPKYRTSVTDPSNDRRSVPRTSLPYDCGESILNYDTRYCIFPPTRSLSHSLAPVSFLNQSPRY